MLKEFQQELKLIQEGQPRPYYLLYGDDDYMQNDYLQKLLDALLPYSDADFGVITINAEQTTSEEICESLQNEPLLPVRKITVIKNSGAFKNKEKVLGIAQKMESYLRDDVLRATKEFCRLLRNAGLSVESIKDGAWQSFSNDEWGKIVGTQLSESRNAWLPIVTEICLRPDFQPPQEGSGSALQMFLQETSPSEHIIIFVEDSADKNNKTFKLINATGIVFHFEKIKKEIQQKDALIEIAKASLEQAQKKITPSAWEIIGRKIGYDFYDAMNAINKLIAYVGEKNIIDANDVEVAIGKTKEDAIFELSSALTRKDMNGAVSLLADLLERGEHHQVILAVISREIRMLLHANILLSSQLLSGYKKNISYPDFVQTVFPKLKNIAQAEGEDLLCQHPYGAFLALKNTGVFSFSQLVQYLEKLAQIDILFKSSPKEPQLLLEQFIIAVCTTLTDDGWTG
ncbi:MAG: DNA polymerase III subunit delta [Deltaproteobacteria bacterium]